MRILLISDVHSNLMALEAVLDDVDRYRRVDSMWCIGDTIGYGPRPNECIAIVRERADHTISGNHDMACLGTVDIQDFNPDARVANEWNGEQLTEGNREWLASLAALMPQVPDFPDFTLAHGSPRQPIWEYLLSVGQALENFTHENFQTQVCFIGHSHIPIYFRDDYQHDSEVKLPPDGDILKLDPNRRYIINPGSVGQPRNRDPRAAFAILDLEEQVVEFHRVEYDVHETQEQMRAVGLPAALIRRIQFGF
jgi:diadenosine tetraphosphatase ApaH/serine/threonine PP2A family protein phosphatase